MVDRQNAKTIPEAPLDALERLETAVALHSSQMCEMADDSRYTEMVNDIVTAWGMVPGDAIAQLRAAIRTPSETEALKVYEEQEPEGPQGPPGDTTADDLLDAIGVLVHAPKSIAKIRAALRTPEETEGLRTALESTQRFEVLLRKRCCRRDHAGPNTPSRRGRGGFSQPRTGGKSMTEPGDALEHARQAEALKRAIATEERRPDYETESLRLGEECWIAQQQQDLRRTAGDYPGHLRARVAFHRAYARLCELEAETWERAHRVTRPLEAP